MKNTGEKDPLQTDDPWKPDHTQQEEATSAGEGANNDGDKTKGSRRTTRSSPQNAKGKTTGSKRQLYRPRSEIRGPSFAKKRREQEGLRTDLAVENEDAEAEEPKRPEEENKREMTLSESRRFSPR